jgi:hypothetical protein
MKLVQILGYKLTEIGKIHPILLERLKKGLEIYQTDSNYKFIVSGGNPPNEPNKNQAKAMRKWLIENKVPRERIILEDESISTIEQLLYLHKHLQEQEYNKVHIVGTEGGFDKRIELLCQFIFGTEKNIDLEGATLPQEISKDDLYQFTKGEEKRINVIKRLLEEEFLVNKVEKLRELTSRHREGDVDFFKQIGYEFSSEYPKEPLS